MYRGIAFYVTACLALNGLSFCLQARDLQQASHLLQLMKFESQLENGRDVCMSRPEQIDVVALYEKSPVLFFDVSPSSDMWPDVVAAYMSYLKEMCVPSSIDEYSELARSIYGSELTPEELKAAISFFESEVGKKLVSASVEVTDAMNKRMLLEADEGAESSWNAYADKARKIKDLKEAESGDQRP